MDQIANSIAEASKSSYDEEEEDRLDRLENGLNAVLKKLDELQHDTRTYSNSSSVQFVRGDVSSPESVRPANGRKHRGSFSSGGKCNYLDNSVVNAPLNVISRLDGKLFRRINNYTCFMDLCRTEFLTNFYYPRKEFCLKLGTNFLNIAHFWIVPGGIKSISNDYVEQHPLISAVFVLLAMGFDENYSYVEEQHQLYWIVRKMLSMALSTTPLTDHDCEAILYCSLYNIARKPAQPLLDNWITSGSGVKHMMLSSNFYKIRTNVKEKRYEPDDLFHVRIFTLLAISHLQNSIGSGRPHTIPNDYFDVCDLLIKFPQSNLEDTVNHAAVQLARTAHKLFYVKDLIMNLMRDEEFSTYEDLQCFKFEDLHKWKVQWSELIHQDVSGVLMFNYDFYHVTLSRRFLSSYKSSVDSETTKYIEIAYNTAMAYCMSILTRFLKLPKSIVKGSPSFLLTQIVYSCVTLYDFQSRFDAKFSTQYLSLVSKVYWHLNHVGETRNDATDTVGQIIKTLVDVRSVNGVSADGASSGAVNGLEPPLDGGFEFDYKPLHDEISYEYSSDMRSALLDVERFETFEEFFKGIVSQ
ncbi:Uracil catabolism protein 2 [Cyberlindnera fabianii]|nr:Uracil catabolism protein 2 [Cyberlindnera fabianii]